MDEPTNIKQDRVPVSRIINRQTFLKVAALAGAAALGGGAMAALNLKDNLLLGFWRFMIPVPGPIWRKMVRSDVEGVDLAFMSQAHHDVRDLVVTEIPRVGKSLSPTFISQQLDIPEHQVISILDDLERKMTFLFRRGGDDVVWAYPVTAEPTAHRIHFSTGERTYGA